MRSTIFLSRIGAYQIVKNLEGLEPTPTRPDAYTPIRFSNRPKKVDKKRGFD
jgi:hypothetical protein